MPQRDKNPERDFKQRLSNHTGDTRQAICAGTLFMDVNGIERDLLMPKKIELQLFIQACTKVMR